MLLKNTAENFSESSSSFAFDAVSEDTIGPFVRIIKLCSTIFQFTQICEGVQCEFHEMFSIIATINS